MAKNNPPRSSGALLDGFDAAAERAAQIEQRRQEYEAQQREQRRVAARAAFDASKDEMLEQQRAAMRNLLRSWF